MRRFNYNGDLNKLVHKKYDVIIVGSGIAGMYTAMNLDEGLSCLILSKDKSDTCNSWYAQGGVAAVTLSNDDPEYHIKDTLVAGAGLCKVSAVETLVKEGPGEIKKLLEMGAPFDHSSDGQLMVTREGGHGMNRILHCGGDATGRELTRTLAARVAEKKNITIMTNIFLTDILTTEDNEAAGVIVNDGEYKVFLAPNIVVCTGGVGQVYKYTTNPVQSTGDGMAAALRAGAKLEDMEFVQFHPTALAINDGGARYFLISEAVRGEGGILRNAKGERFMQGVHPSQELAPRDIVTRAIFREMKRTNTKNVYLDITHKSAEFLSGRFPTIYNFCMENGIDISKEYIPVVPVQHYMMGGIATDLNGMTSVEGLYACGEVSCTGVHGANRLASNSLLECLVFGNRSAQHINKAYRVQKPFVFKQNRTYAPQYEIRDYDIMKSHIKEIMMEYCGIMRNEKDLERGYHRMRSMRVMLENSALDDIKIIEVLNMADIAERILKSAIQRRESVGAHYRED